MIKGKMSDDQKMQTSDNGNYYLCDEEYEILPNDDLHYHSENYNYEFEAQLIAGDSDKSENKLDSSADENFKTESEENLPLTNPSKRLPLKKYTKPKAKNETGNSQKRTLPDLKQMFWQKADRNDKNKENSVSTGENTKTGAEIKKSAINDYLNAITTIFRPEEVSDSEFIPYVKEYPVTPEIDKILFEPELEILDSYWLKPPHSYAVIVSDSDSNKKYMVFEPKISEKELLILEETDAQLRAVILYDPSLKKDGLKLNSDMVYRIIRNLDPKISDERISIICYYLERNFQGYGKLDALMQDENIEDITCNGPDIPVFIFHRKYSNLPVNIIFDTNELNKFVLKIAQKADKQLSLTAPLVDAALPEGARAQITYTDVVSSKGSSFTIRKFKSDPMTPVDLIDYGTYDAEILAFIWLCVENRKSAIVVGGTASGKTSMMNAFSLFIPQFAKIVSIEDTREIQMPHKNWLPMKTRESSSESGKGNVDMFSLLKTALRQRPEYIIVGEVRGSEAQTLFQAMNTGHTTYSTLHAGGVEQAINRLTTNPINVPVAMFGALDLMIIQQLQYIGGRMVRRCITIDEVIAEKGDISYNILYKWDPVKDKFKKICKESRIINEIAYSHGWTIDETLRQVEIRKEILEGLLSNGIRSSDEITAVFDEFSKSGRYEFEE